MVVVAVVTICRTHYLGNTLLESVELSAQLLESSLRGRHFGGELLDLACGLADELVALLYLACQSHNLLLGRGLVAF